MISEKEKMENILIKNTFPAFRLIDIYYLTLFSRNGPRCQNDRGDIII